MPQPPFFPRLQSAGTSNSTSDPDRDVDLTVIVPIFNEQEALPALHQRLAAALSATDAKWEILYVDDGSADATPAMLSRIQAADRRVGVARLSRNFGKEAAMSAGLQLARGRAVVIIDADLQDPPELIGAMLDAWRAGAEAVNMRRRTRQGESWFKRFTAHAFYRVINRLSDVPIPADVGDFRLLSRRVVDVLNELPERTRFMKGLFAWVGFQQVTIEYDRHPRAAGTTKWRYSKLWRFAVEGIASFSLAPLKLATHAGMFSALVAFAYSAYFVVKTAIFGEPVQGFPTLIVTVLMLGGLQLMATGILGEYVGRIFVESKRRPLFVLDHHQPAAGVETAGAARAAA